MGSWTGDEPEIRHDFSESVKIHFFKWRENRMKIGHGGREKEG